MNPQLNSIAANMRHHLCRDKSLILYIRSSDCPKIIDREVKGIVWISTSEYCGPEELPSGNGNDLSYGSVRCWENGLIPLATDFYV